MTAEASRRVTSPESDATARTLIALLEPVLATPGARQRIAIGVAGESGSGKTMTAVALGRALESRGLAVATLHQDDYFLRPPRANHEHRRGHREDVGPQEVNLARLEDHVAAFRARRAVQAPVVDYATDTFHTRALDFAGVHVLIVEGTYVLVLQDLDVRVFLSATHEDTRSRREARARDVHEDFVDDVLRIEHRCVAAQAPVAHIVVDRDFHVVQQRPLTRPVQHGTDGATGQSGSAVG